MHPVVRDVVLAVTKRKLGLYSQTDLMVLADESKLADDQEESNFSFKYYGFFIIKTQFFFVVGVIQ
jgi:hypothetical protein